MYVGLWREDGEQDVVEFVLGHRDGVVRRMDQLVDLLVVPLDHLQQLAQVGVRIPHKFGNLQVTIDDVFLTRSVWPDSAKFRHFKIKNLF